MAKETTKHEGDKNNITVGGKEFQRNSRALWSFPPETRMMGEYHHPAMFPEELPRRLIQQLTYKDDVVLDPFSGAGTTCTVAKQLSRKYIGIEMSEKYYKTSLNRLSLTPNTIINIDEKGKETVTAEWMN
jgi:site-specific DNA-methyltransferase (adenine-specific)